MSSPDAAESNAEDLYLESFAFTTAAAIVGYVDRKVFILLRDGRTLFGILRTFDQFANLVLQDTIERIHLPAAGGRERFGEIARGVFMVRGENVVMCGELDIDREDDHLHAMQQVLYDDAAREWEKERAQRVLLERERSRALARRGLVSDFSKGDMY